MKRAPIFLPLLATAVLVTACGSSETPADPSTTPTTTLAAPAVVEAPGPTGIPDGMGSPGVDDGVFP
ncbi:MAG: iron-siderophore ABC transporter substrate-binding protein, partial [Rhodococcus fascians]